MSKACEGIRMILFRW